MAIHSLFPGFVYLYYNAADHDHRALLPVIPGDPPVDNDWTLVESSGAEVNFTTAVAALITLLRPLYNVGASFNRAELWTLASESADPQFRQAVDISLAGTSVADSLLYGRFTFTYRSAGGNLLRNVLMEAAIGDYSFEGQPPTYGDSAVAALINYLTGDDGWIVARDGTYPVNCIRVLGKYDDAMRRRYQI